MAWKALLTPDGEPGVLVPDETGRSLGVLISRAEFERREAAMTPERRALRDALVAGFAETAKTMREANQRDIAR
jgi:hypothetical protein